MSMEERWMLIRDMLTLRVMMNRFIQEGFARPAMAVLSTALGGIPIDLTETEDSYVIRATMPGNKPEDIQITVHDDVVTIRGEGAREEQRRDQNYILRERRLASSSRTVTLPGAVNADQADATYEHGMLQLTLPKSTAARRRHIPIKTPRQASTGQPPDTPVAAQQALPTSDVSEGRSDTRQPLDQPVHSMWPGQATQSRATAISGEDNGGSALTRSTYDPVDEAIAESFPASDPPAWIASWPS